MVGRVRADGSRVKRRCRNHSASTSVKIQGSPPHSEAMLNHEEGTLIVSGPKADHRESQCAEKDSEAKVDQTEETPTTNSEANDAEEETWSDREARILWEEDSEEKKN